MERPTNLAQRGTALSLMELAGLPSGSHPIVGQILEHGHVRILNAGIRVPQPFGAHCWRQSGHLNGIKDMIC